MGVGERERGDRERNQNKRTIGIRQRRRSGKWLAGLSCGEEKKKGGHEPVTPANHSPCSGLHLKGKPLGARQHVAMVTGFYDNVIFDRVGLRRGRDDDGGGGGGWWDIPETSQHTSQPAGGIKADKHLSPWRLP